MAKWFTIIDERENRGFKKWLKLFGKGLFWLLLSFVLVLTVSGILGLIFEKQVTERAVTELNKNLKTPIEAQSVELSLIKKFPYASIELKNVRCSEVYERQGTQDLFNAGSVFLQFNIWDFLFKKYTIKKIAIKNANVKLFKDSLGKDNWHFWKGKTTPVEGKTFEFSLSSMTLEYCTLQYESLIDQLALSFKINQLNLTGKLNENQFKASAEVDAVAEKVWFAGREFASQQKIKASTTVDVNSESEEYAIKYGKVDIDEMIFNIAGAAQKSGNYFFTDIKINASGLNLAQFLKTFHTKFHEKQADFDYGGELSLELKLKGPYGQGRIPGIRAKIDVAKGFYKDPIAKINSDEIHFKAIYIKDDSTSIFNDILEINQFEFKYLNNNISGELKIKNLQKPYLKLKAKSKIWLSPQWAPLESNISGTFKIELSYSGKVSGEGMLSELTTYNSTANFENLISSSIIAKEQEEPISGVVNCLNEVYEVINDDSYASAFDVYVQWLEFEISMKMVAAIQSMVNPFYFSDKTISWPEGRASFYDNGQNMMENENVSSGNDEE